MFYTKRGEHLDRLVRFEGERTDNGGRRIVRDPFVNRRRISEFFVLDSSEISRISIEVVVTEILSNKFIFIRYDYLDV